jgi:hypothetical protein
MSISVKSYFIWTCRKNAEGTPSPCWVSDPLHDIKFVCFGRERTYFFRERLRLQVVWVNYVSRDFTVVWGVIASQLDAETIYIPHNMYCSRWYPKLAGWPHDHSIIID